MALPHLGRYDFFGVSQMSRLEQLTFYDPSSAAQSRWTICPHDNLGHLLYNHVTCRSRTCCRGHEKCERQFRNIMVHVRNVLCLLFGVLTGQASIAQTFLGLDLFLVFTVKPDIRGFGFNTLF